MTGRRRPRCGSGPRRSMCILWRSGCCTTGGWTRSTSTRATLDPKLGALRRPDDMAGFVAALDVIEAAHKRRDRVGVFGDYDVDGVSTAATISTYLEALGLEVVVRVAHRERGYGFGIPDAEALHEAGVKLVILGDTGTSDVDALAWLAERGIKTVVIDHHQVPESAPPADAFINPHQPGCGFPFKGLCSAGVAFYLCAALRTRLSRSHRRVPDPRRWLDLVAVATVCDMMPLREENRVLVHAGLRHLSRRGRPGLRALLARAGVPTHEAVDEQHVAFKIGPRLNAPGRLGSAEPSLRLLQARTDGGGRGDRGADRDPQRPAQALHGSDGGGGDGPPWSPSPTSTRAPDWSSPTIAGSPAWPGSRRPSSSNTMGGPPPSSPSTASAARRGDRCGRCRGSTFAPPSPHAPSCSPASAATERPLASRCPRTNVDAFTEAFDAAVAEQQAAAGAPPDIEVVDCALPLRIVEPQLCAAMRRAGPFRRRLRPPALPGRGRDRRPRARTKGPTPLADADPSGHGSARGNSFRTGPTSTRARRTDRLRIRSVPRPFPWRNQTPPPGRTLMAP